MELRLIQQPCPSLLAFDYRLESGRNPPQNGCNRFPWSQPANAQQEAKLMTLFEKVCGFSGCGSRCVWCYQRFLFLFYYLAARLLPMPTTLLSCLSPSEWLLVIYLLAIMHTSRTSSKVSRSRRTIRPSPEWNHWSEILHFDAGSLRRCHSYFLRDVIYRPIACHVIPD